MQSEIKGRLTAIFREHPGLLVSAFYVAASVIGMFYSWAYLRHFGINVFNYAQISDFLLASLKEPFTWALVALSVVLVTLDNAYSRHVERKKPGKWIRWYGSSRYRLINNLVALVLLFSFIYAYGDHQAGQTRNGAGKLVAVQQADSDTVDVAILLGTTGQFVFLYQRGADRVVIHPIESIQSISFQASP
ncbi:MAG: hypothetical protein WBN07_17145 [Woeseiaceae bacterium]